MTTHRQIYDEVAEWYQWECTITCDQCISGWTSSRMHTWDKHCHKGRALILSVAEWLAGHDYVLKDWNSRGVWIHKTQHRARKTGLFQMLYGNPHAGDVPEGFQNTHPRPRLMRWRGSVTGRFPRPPRPQFGDVTES